MVCVCVEWAWQDDDGQWVPYPPAVCAEITTAFQAGKKCVSLSLGPGYDLDLVKMMQTNTVTKYHRKIRKSGENHTHLKLLIMHTSHTHTAQTNSLLLTHTPYYTHLTHCLCLLTVCVDEGEGSSGLRIKEEGEEEEEKPVTKKRRGGVKKCEDTKETESKGVVSS